MKTPPNSAAPAPARPEQKIAESTVAWAQGLGRNDDIVHEVELKARRACRRRLSVSSAAGACLLLVGLVFYARSDVFRRGVFPPASTAVVSVPERQTLNDGSVVEFKEGTRFTAAFGTGGDGVRRVILASGEAHFSVKEDSARPFIVEAGGVEVWAVGTAFSVAFDQSQVAVLVTEGRVAVGTGRMAEDGSRRSEIGDQRPEIRGQMSDDKGETSEHDLHPHSHSAGHPHSAVGGPLGPTLPHSVAPVYVDAGRRLVVEMLAPGAQAPAPVLVAPGEIAQHLSWRAPRIRFVNTALSEAVAVFNRHSTVRLVLDPTLADLRIGGVVRADNTESFLLLLNTEFGIEPESAADGSLRLRRR